MESEEVIKVADEPQAFQRRSIQRSDNFRRNIKKRYGSQSSVTSHDGDKMTSQHTSYPDRLLSQSSMGSDSGDSSYLSAGDSSDSVSEKSLSFSDVSAGSDGTDLSKAAQDTISGLADMIQNMDNLSVKSDSGISEICDKNESDKGFKDVIDNSDLTNEGPDVNQNGDETTETSNKKRSHKLVRDDTLEAIGSVAENVAVGIGQGIGLLGQAAIGAWDFFSATLDQLKPADSDSEGEFHDAGSDLSDDAADDEFQDANEDLNVRLNSA